MKPRYRKFRQKSGIYYVWDNQTARPKSLKTRDPHDADRQVHAMNEAVRTPQINRQMARAYLMASDPGSLSRTRQASWRRSSGQ